MLAQFSAEQVDVSPNAHSAEEVDLILSKAERAFSSWRETSFPERAKLLRQFADLLDSNKEELARTISMEMGKLIKQSRQEIEKCSLTSRFYADNAHLFLADEPVKAASKESYISYQPLGPILAVMPWNFPFWQVIRFAAPALMAGNVAVLKHASNVPKCALLMVRLFREAGFPESVFEVIFVQGDRMDMVIKDPRIKAVTLTGSEAAGSKVAEASGKMLKKTVLELGGSDPFIVLEDADIEKASEAAVKARMINTGQSCIAAKRFIVVESIAEIFIAAIKNKFASLKMGRPFDESADYGPMAKVELAKSLNDQVQRSISMGAKRIFGRDWLPEDEAFFPATLLTSIKPGMPAYEEELFGPVASIFIVKDDQEAIYLANDTRFGLGASLWSNDISRAKKLAEKIESGSVFINKIVASDPNLPFGGVKMSGYGRELSYLGIREFTNIKTISID